MIPRLLHHVWPGRDALREPFRSYRASWIAHHPDWSMMFWRLESPEGRPLRGEVAEVLSHPDRSVVVKSDVLRLYALAQWGGVYVDTDCECLRSFEPLLDAKCFCGMESVGFACPSVLGAVREHPLIVEMLRAALDRLKRVSVDEANRRPHQITGPHLLTEILKKHHDVVVHPRQVFYPREGEADSFSIHHWAGSGPDGWRYRLTLGKPEPVLPPLEPGRAYCGPLSDEDVARLTAVGGSATTREHA